MMLLLGLGSLGRHAAATKITAARKSRRRAQRTTLECVCEDPSVFGDSKAFNSFAVNDLDAAQKFYGETLGLRTAMEGEHLMELRLQGARSTIVYEKPDHQPANFTVLNFSVEDIEKAVDELVERGVALERYEGFGQDGRGIAQGPGPRIAWFKDPAGNVLSVLQER
jgi:predicted enzyme related to lactoylglutathione lyase